MSDRYSGLAAWLALNRLEGLGGVRFRMLAERFADPTALLDQPEPALQALGLPAPLRAAIRAARQAGAPLHRQVQADLAWLADAPQVRAITWLDAAYPPLLRAIADPPPLLFVGGDPALLGRPQLALVGSRQATHAGMETAFAFARALAAAGLAVTSGLAHGIDAAAHRGALAAEGHTLAVMATGLDSIYPRAHRDLAAAMLAAGGALVSEFPPGTRPLAGLFPRRNRIIAGLSMGVLVVEAAPRSGTLITARLAMEQGREVFAIPGSIHQPQSRGCHRLIRDGATLVETVDDILAELGGFRDWRRLPPVAAAAAALPAVQTAVLACTDFSPTPVDAIVARSGLAAADVMGALTELELTGRIVAEAGGYSRLP